MKKILIAFFLLATINSFAQTTYVPDDNFEQELINLGYDDVLDDHVLTANISSLTVLDVSDKNISDLTGIESFVSLTELICSFNQLSSLDVSANTLLTKLWCSGNQLTSIDISHNTALLDFACGINQLTSLDVSHNTSLTNLGCHENQITSLDVSVNTALVGLWCQYNQIESLDISSNTALTGFGCNDNRLISLDVSNNTLLTGLYCQGNEITGLDVSQNTALIALDCSFNQITSLDVSSNTALFQLWCHYNQLTSLDVRNGNNYNFNFFVATGHPDLTCIYVDDAAYSTVNWLYVDESSTFVETEGDCSALGIEEDNNIANFCIYPNPVNDNFSIKMDDRIESVEVYDSCGRLVKKFSRQQENYSVVDLVNGLYLLKIKTVDGAVNSRLLIE